MSPMLRFTVRVDSRSDQTALSETPRRLALVVALADVRFAAHYGPNSDEPSPKSAKGLMHRSKASLFDHLVGADKKRGRHSKAERFGSLHVDHELEFDRLLYRQIGGLDAFEDLVDVSTRTVEQIG